MSHSSLVSALVSGDLLLSADCRPEGGTGSFGPGGSKAVWRAPGWCWAQRAGKTVDWQGHRRRESFIPFGFAKGSPCFPAVATIPWVLVMKVPCVGRQAVLLKRVVFRGWWTWIKVPASSPPTYMDLSKSPCYLKPQFPNLWAGGQAAPASWSCGKFTTPPSRL